MTTRRDERPFSAVPGWLAASLLLALAAQLAVHHFGPAAGRVARPLPPAPPATLVELAALGEAQLAGRMLMLWLQAWDTQPGISVPLQSLDYPRLRDWLRVSAQLAPHSRYPHLAAARLYAEVPDPARQRLMLDFVHEQFLQAPAERWQWLAHAVFVARHRLGDLPLALRYATALAEHTAPGEAPPWARQMRIFVLADMGETAAARVLLGALLTSDQGLDPAERRFLAGRLAELERRQ
ncbi:MAG: hypothetical protein HKO62_09830 [Gammaproteobacteria bacterium]|nr:hypothetical protein [Gammaproteobacteria bacterium]NNM01038.1 hypothetical protein [Gammaproteobacteria bacterium]